MAIYDIGGNPDPKQREIERLDARIVALERLMKFPLSSFHSSEERENSEKRLEELKAKRAELAGGERGDDILPTPFGASRSAFAERAEERKRGIEPGESVQDDYGETDISGDVEPPIESEQESEFLTWNRKLRAAVQGAEREGDIESLQGILAAIEILLPRYTPKEGTPTDDEVERLSDTIRTRNMVTSALARMTAPEPTAEEEAGEGQYTALPLSREVGPRRVVMPETKITGKPAAIRDEEGRVVMPETTITGDPKRRVRMPETTITGDRKAAEGREEEPLTVRGKIPPGEDPPTIDDPQDPRWKYKQYTNGVIKIVAAPPGRRAGAVLSGGSAHAAITKAIRTVKIPEGKLVAGEEKPEPSHSLAQASEFFARTPRRGIMPRVKTLILSLKKEQGEGEEKVSKSEKRQAKKAEKLKDKREKIDEKIGKLEAKGDASAALRP